MKKHNNVSSYEEKIKPINMEKTYIYIKINIKKIDDMWLYDEIVLTYEEYEQLKPVIDEIVRFDNEINELKKRLEKIEQNNKNL